MGYERRARMHAAGRAIGYVERRTEPLPDPLPATLVAFYLPQFHTIPENDAWWGKGFTEWRNVARALPQFEGHLQPRLPGDLGFYDLGNSQVMRDQAELARAYGISAFCFYFYWFGGRTLLEDPLKQWLTDPSIDLSFCLCWANENWTRRWDGRDHEALIGQSHSAEDDLAFIEHIHAYLADRRYLRVEGRPLLLVYRPGLLPDPQATAMRWRTWCREHGVGEIHLAYVQSFERPAPAMVGFDSAVEFPPNLSSVRNLTAGQILINPGYRGEVMDWRDVATDHMERRRPGYTVFPGVNCGWDNEPRRSGRGRSFVHASPRRYRDWLAHTVFHRLADQPRERRTVFINAWNEWAEGAVLEPDQHLGHAWLQATRDALHVPAAHADASSSVPVVVVHAWYIELLDEILDALEAGAFEYRLLVTCAPEKASAVRTIIGMRNVPAEVEPFDNRGRDILPFLQVASRLLDRGDRLVLKIHTKRSPHLRSGDQWRRDLIGALLPPGQTAGIINAFDANPSLGLVAPDGHLCGVGELIGGNSDAVHYLGRRMGLRRCKPLDARFAAGSMYWIRLDALRPVLDAHLGEWEFESEYGQIDGTLAHAMERMIGASVEEAGFGMRTASEVCIRSAPGELRHPYTGQPRR